ncbi:MAG TPA: 2Fe-2S iron-sulfur cluster-binding protein [Acidobacteriota bacterium]|nr:2Fe-2S iron-sulfur cluster-binding protein [Acidobacteriota bacterium]
MRRVSQAKEDAISKVIFNDEELDVEVGQNLLTPARRRGLHVWFLCDGRGLCQTCQCRVLSGADNLNQPTKIEVDTISESRRRNGFRLACQTSLARQGDVGIISLAEQMRRQAAEFMTFQRGTDFTGSVTDLLNDLAGFAADLAGGLPSIAQSIIPQLIDAPPSLGGVWDYLRDGQHVMGRVLSNPLTTGKK